MQVFCLTYEFRLKPTQQQQQIFEDWLETNRRVYNYALAERKDWYHSRSCQIDSCNLKSEYIIPADTPRPNFASQCKTLTQARKELPTLGRVHSQVLQQTLKRLESAFTSMWELSSGFPRFKKKGRMRSFVFPQLGKDPLKPKMVKLPMIGWVKYRSSREIPPDATVKQARIIKRASGWYVMLALQWDVEVPPVMPHGHAVGIDVGLTNFVATSDGLTLSRPRFFVDLERKLKSLQQRVSKKTKGSNNRKKAQKRVSKLYEKIANTRSDYHWKLAHHICDTAGMVFVEDLNFKALAKGMLGKHCLDAGWGSFLTKLEQVCFKRNVFFLKVDSRKTSQICPNCLVETGKKELSERVHQCSECNYCVDRDVAAAMVVKHRGLAAVGHTVKMLSEGNTVALPVMKESPHFYKPN
jgi:putative transposase